MLLFYCFSWLFAFLYLSARWRCWWNKINVQGCCVGGWRLGSSWWVDDLYGKSYAVLRQGRAICSGKIFDIFIASYPPQCYVLSDMIWGNLFDEKVHCREFYSLDLQEQEKHFLPGHLQKKVVYLLYLLQVLSSQTVKKVEQLGLMRCFPLLGEM